MSEINMACRTTPADKLSFEGSPRPVAGERAWRVAAHVGGLTTAVYINQEQMAELAVYIMKELST